jgi:hypothetical protein
MDRDSLEGVVGVKASCEFGVIACSCFLFRGVRWGAILGCLLASWKCRHVRMTEDEQPKLLPYTADITFVNLDRRG